MVDTTTVISGMSAGVGTMSISTADFGLRLLDLLQAQSKIPLHGTTQSDGSVTIHDDRGVLVAEVHTDGTATVIKDDQSVILSAADLPQESNNESDKDALSLEAWASAFEEKAFSESSTWNQQAQTQSQNCSKSFADTSSNYTAKPEVQVPSPPASRREGVEGAQSDAKDRPRLGLIAGGGLQGVEGVDVELPAIAPDAGILEIPSAPAPASVVGIGDLVRELSPEGSSSSSDVPSSGNARGHEHETGAHEVRPGVSELVSALSRAARFAEKIFHRQGDGALESTPLQDALALHAAHRSRLRGRDAVVTGGMLESWSKGIDWKRALTESAVAWSAFLGQALHSPVKSARGAEHASPLGAMLQAMVSDLGVDPLAIAYATSAAGIFQLPPLNFVGHALASSQAQVSQTHLLDRVTPPHSSSRGHGREEGESQQGGQQEHHQQDQYPADESSTEPV